MPASCIEAFHMANCPKGHVLTERLYLRQAYIRARRNPAQASAYASTDVPTTQILGSTRAVFVIAHTTGHHLFV